MDYDVIRTSINDAYLNYKYDNKKFYKAMCDFYTEGKKNPSVAKILMKDHITKGRLAANKMLKAAAALSLPDVPMIIYPEIIEPQRRVHNLAISSAIRSIEAEDIYDNARQLDEKYAEIGNNSRELFDRSWNELYPRTGAIRERVIDANRITADGVNVKADWLEKINFAKTIKEYKKDYPKTFFARYWLIMNEHIKEDGVSFRVEGWFKRFSYKRLIKGSFGFKK